ncbi:MAG: LD-carboxypeptidase [Candidatus Thermoplasmatota archaeon]|nr:LD-carboxypeptidase [Candidatus Thermoplasmatota archaeon]
MKLLKPARLRKGDTICVVSPSSFSEPFGLGQGVNYLRSRGYRVVLGECTRNLTRTGHIAGKDEARARELVGAFADDSIDAVWCSRGGWGAMRILDLVDFDVIRKNPKIFIGYSDITTLHIAMHQRTGLVTFHGPSIEGYAGDNPEKDPPSGKENIDRALSLLSKAEPWGRIDNPPAGMLLRTVVPGKAKGLIVGGNLSMIVHTLGTDDSIDTDGKLLFLEDVFVSEYDIERLLTHLHLARKLQMAKGIIFGQVSTFHKRDEPTPSLEDVIQDRLGILRNIPSFTGLCCGHGRHRLVIPEGVKASMDATNPRLTVEESPLGK